MSTNVVKKQDYNHIFFEDTSMFHYPTQTKAQLSKNILLCKILSKSDKKSVCLQIKNASKHIYNIIL